MRTVRHLLRTPLRFSVFIAFLGFTVLGFIAKSGTTKQGDIRVQRSRQARDLRVEDLTIRNETKGFTVTAVAKTPEGHIRITLRNDYSKTIVAYQFSLGSKTTLVDSFTNALKVGIEAGEVREEVEAIDVDPELFGRGIIVRAVVFNDATADGDPLFIRQINEFRLGEMLQTEQLLSSLNNIEDASGPELPSQLERAKSTMLNLEQDKQFSADVRSGLRNMRLVFSRNLDAIREANEKDRTQIIRGLASHYRSKFNDIRDYIEKTRQRQLQQVR